MGKLFDGVRAAVTAEMAAERYGLIPSKWKRAALCPWHSDTNPSLHFYRDSGRCWCFACNQGGSAIDLTAQVFGLSPLDAARKLNNDFNLGLDVRGSPPPEGETPAMKQKREQEEHAAAVDQAYERYVNAFRLLHDHGDEITLDEQWDAAAQMAQAADELYRLDAGYLVA